MIYEENGQIIVDELRPMSEATNDPVMVVSVHYGTELFFAYKSTDWDINKTWVLFGFTFLVHESELIGYIPVPTYRPKVE